MTDTHGNHWACTSTPGGTTPTVPSRIPGCLALRRAGDVPWHDMHQAAARRCDVTSRRYSASPASSCWCVPQARTCPASSTTIRSACATVESRCAMASTARSRAARSTTARSTCSLSRPAGRSPRRATARRAGGAGPARRRCAGAATRQRHPVWPDRRRQPLGKPVEQRSRPGDPAYEARAARLLEPVLALLSGYGLPDADLVHAARTLRSALHGFVTLELHAGFGLDLNVGDSFDWMLDTLERGLVPRPPTARSTPDHRRATPPR